MAFKRKDFLLIVGVLFFLIGLMGVGLPPIYAIIISLTIYFGIRIFVGRRKKMIEESKFDYPKEHKNYIPPQVLTNVDHGMKFMMEETSPIVLLLKEITFGYVKCESLKVYNEIYNKY